MQKWGILFAILGKNDLQNTSEGKGITELNTDDKAETEIKALFDEIISLMDR